MQFGDRPAAALMTIAVEKAAETYKDVARDLNLSVKEVKKDSKKLLEDTYVDNGTTGSSIKEVDRMIGVKLPDGSFSGTIPSMMKKVGLKLKTIVTLHSNFKKPCQSCLIRFWVVSTIHCRISLVLNSPSILQRRRREQKSA